MTKMKDSLPANRANWKFNGEVVELFDKHISRSVPLYKEGHDLICDMSDFFIKPDSLCYEIGCSTGTLTLKLATHNQKKPEARFVGIDIEKDMIAKVLVTSILGNKIEETISLTKGINNIELTNFKALSNGIYLIQLIDEKKYAKTKRKN